MDNHVGFAGQSILWDGLFPRLAKKCRLIISTRRIFPLLLERHSVRRDDAIVERVDGYAALCVHLLGGAIRRFTAEEPPLRGP